jgi:hypothetical protein
MRKLATIAGAASILAALTGCGSATVAHHPHHPAAAPETAAQRHGAYTICSLFVASTKLTSDLGETSGPAEQQMLNKVLYGKHIPIDSQILRDAEALVAAPTSGTAQRLQADCAAVGVYQPVWAPGG